jgi:hypothetical protein
MKKIMSMIIAAVALSMIAGCSDSEVASYNVSQDAHQFKVFRRVVFYNGITGDYILEIRAFCSVTPESDGRLSVIIKTENGTYLKHYLGLSDNVTYFAEQLGSKPVDVYHYRVIFRPETIIPNIDIETSIGK